MRINIQHPKYLDHLDICWNMTVYLSFPLFVNPIFGGNPEYKALACLFNKTKRNLINQKY